MTLLMKDSRVNIYFSNRRIDSHVKKKAKRCICSNCILWYLSKAKYKLPTGNRSLLKMHLIINKI